MAHLIDKDAVLAEIEKMLQEEYPCDNSEQTVGYHCALYELQDFLDTLEVKEVDLDAELEHYKAEQNIKYEEDINMFEFAKHFFELGLKAQKGEQ